MANILCVAIRKDIGLYFKPIIFFDERETCIGCLTSLIFLVQILCGPINRLTELGPVEGASQCQDMPVECINVKDQDSPPNAAILKLALCVSETLQRSEQ